MNKEMDALVSRETWDLVSAPTNAIVVGCHRVYTSKYNPDGSVDQYKARFVAKAILRLMGLTIQRPSLRLQS